MRATCPAYLIFLDVITLIKQIMLFIMQSVNMHMIYLNSFIRSTENAKSQITDKFFRLICPPLATKLTSTRSRRSTYGT
jgi:hypothetical protein